MVKERSQAAGKVEKTFGAIKQSSIEFFQKCEARMQAAEGTTQMMLEKYENWSKVLIEPTSMNLARIHALEARLS